MGVWLDRRNVLQPHLGDRASAIAFRKFFDEPSSSGLAPRSRRKLIRRLPATVLACEAALSATVLACEAALSAIVLACVVALSVTR